MKRLLEWVSSRVKSVVNSRFFLFLVALAIGVTYSVSWYEGRAFYSDYLGFNGNGIAVAAVVHVYPQGVSEGHTDRSGEGRSGSPSLEEIGTFTAYTASEEQTDDDPEVMASGKNVYEGAIACPEKYEFGTKIVIENMGTFVCEDRMAKRFRDGNYFDILMEDYSEAMEFGRREMPFEVST